MKKDQCEKAIRALCSRYSRDGEIPMAAESFPSFSNFVSWLNENGYGGYLNFRSTRGPMNDAEAWFDDEFKQNWRN